MSDTIKYIYRDEKNYQELIKSGMEQWEAELKASYFSDVSPRNNSES